uniref:DUF58 domain-containing protein n=1 Tax=uncultured bacterium contig00037 TaxID=1181525 RepID=A0A806JY33_9BACT|nr:protein of unknown function DUF58 [uncultured bacterium contig00037]
MPVFLFTPMALVQFLCLFFLFILIGSRVYSEYLARNIKVSRMDAELRVFRHEWVRVELKVENHGLLPAYMLVVGDLPGNLQVFNMRKTFCTLYRRSWTLLYWDGLCSDRGVFSVGPAVIRGADPLGLFPFSLTTKETSRLFVYPCVRGINLKNKKGIPLGNMLSTNPLFEDITRCRSLRPYYPGDETRRINWKVSAHISGSSQTYGMQTQSAGLLVNEYEATASYPLMIFLNVDMDEYPRKDRKVFIERTIEAAASLCLKASRERQDLGIIIYMSHQEEGRSIIQPAPFTLVPILECLASLNWVKSSNVTNTTSSSSRDYRIGADTVSAEDSSVMRNSALTMLNQGKYLPYGTRYLYLGPDLGDEAYITLNTLRRSNLSLEYLIIDEFSVAPLVPGNSPRYQMKESGYEIL